MSTIGPEVPAHLLNRHKNDEAEHDADLNAPVGPQIPPELLNQVHDDEEEEDDYVPALPPDMVATRSAGPSASGTSASRYARVPGPAQSPYDSKHYSDDDDDDDVGPKPLPPGIKHAETDAVREFMKSEEKRRKELEVSQVHSTPAVLCMKQMSGSWKTETTEKRRMDACAPIIV